MRLIMYIFCIFTLIGCLDYGVGTKDFYFKVKNGTPQSISVIYWGGGVRLQNVINSQETALLEKRRDMNGALVSMFPIYYATDSVQVIFADGKIKTDRKSEIGSRDTVSMYNPLLFVKEICGKKCEVFTYTIDEKDYAEAK